MGSNIIANYSDFQSVSYMFYPPTGYALCFTYTLIPFPFMSSMTLYHHFFLPDYQHLTMQLQCIFYKINQSYIVIVHPNLDLSCQTIKYFISFMLFYVLSRQLFLSCWYYYLCMCWKYQIFIIIILILLSLWLLILSNYIFIFIFRRRRISKGLW